MADANESAGAVVIRELLVRAGVVGGEDAKKDIEELEQSFDKMRGTALKMVAVTGAVVGGLAAVAGSAVALAVSTAQGSQAALQQAAALKEQTENLQELGFAFDSVGQSTVEMTQVLFQLNGRAEDAVNGSKELRKHFGALGISIADIKKAGPVALFEQIADEVANAEDQGAAMARVMKVLGEDMARKVAPLLVQGSDGIRALRQEARELGIVTSEEALVASAKLAVQWGRLQAVGRALRDEIGMALTPVVEEFVTTVLDWVKANRELISLRLEVVVRNLSSLFKDWAPIIAGVSVAFGGLIAAVAGFLALPMIATFAAANAPLLLLAAAVGTVIASLVALGLIIEDISVYFAGGESLIGKLIARFKESHPVVSEFIRLLASMAHLTLTMLGFWGRFALAVSEWGLEIGKAAVKLTPFYRNLKALKDLLTGPLNGTWLGWVADQLQSIAGTFGNVEFRRPNLGNGGAATTNNTTNNTDNSRADITQNITVSGGDAEETVGAALRAGRQAVGGGRR